MSIAYWVMCYIIMLTVILPILTTRVERYEIQIGLITQ